MKLVPRNLAATGVALLLLSFATLAKEISSTPQTIPTPFFFTENKGQCDSRVLYKCQAKNGMTWFLERDGITLLLTQPGNRDSDFGVREGMRSRDNPVADNDPVHRTFLSDDVMDENLPEMLRRHPQKKYPMKSHALKFHFVKGEGSKVKGEREVTDSILHPTPYTLHLTPIFFHPTPFTFHLTPCVSTKC